ncbi:MAG TPA: Ig-like domain-containing protein [Anaerolineales bacterium]|nr:Ig-like domain-containing protein [Anaerolineales bacterium]
MLRQPRRSPLLLYAALGLLAGLLLAALFSRPRVTGHEPASDASDTPAQPLISITFSQAMRPQTVEPRFHINPSRPGAFRWEGRTMTFIASQAWPEATRVEVELAAGAQSLGGLPTLSNSHWSFTVGAGRLAYLWPAGEPADLYTWSASQMEPERLTETAGGIIDFKLTHDGASLIFDADSAGGTQIRELNLADRSDLTLHQCPPESACRNSSLSPDGRMLAFVQEDPRSDAGTLRRVWVKPLDGGEAYLVANEDHPSSQPLWSSLNWLAIYDGALMAYVLYDQVSPEGARLAFVVPNGIGATPAWSPDGEHLIFPEIVFLPEPVPDAGTAVEQPPRFFSHLQRVATADGAQVDLSGDENLLVEDTGPAYSPDGGWIGFSRRSLDPNTWTLGRQIWRMRPDGVDPTQLTDEPELNHGGLAWSPDGTRLAYVLFDQVNPSEPPEVWWRWADGREGGRVMAGGYSPVWIP